MNVYTRAILTIIVLAAIAVAIVYLQTGTPSRTSSAASDIIISSSKSTAEKEGLYEHAKEISTPNGFINTDNTLTIQSLIGKKIILVDFWTYSCINCQRTLPYLNNWYEKYADKGLVIIGVHTPEFAFEQEYDNVRRAVEKFGVHYPVVLDNDYSTWMAYKNRYWPRKYLIDIDGFVVYDHIGEGGYEETEAKIIELLNERAARLGESSVQKIAGMPEETTNFSQIRTPETYLGGARVEYLGNRPATSCEDGACTYVSSGHPLLNSFELSGVWRIGDEEAELVGNEGGSILLHFSAGKVNLVAGATGNPVSADVYLDGKLITAEAAGSDVAGGVVTFSLHDLYNLVDLKGEYGEHILEIRFKKGGISAFAFTFG